MKGMISVIVPVYNVERYLRQCLASIQGQTYKNLEIILIDDGSTDNSSQICEEFALQDMRIKVIRQKNGGAANAKNVGLKIAKGEYLAFVDSDDYLEKDAYAHMVDQLEKNDADVIQCNFRNVYVDSTEDCVMLKKIGVFMPQDFLKRFTIDWTCGLLWDKLYRRNLFDKVFFEEGHIIDDEFFTYQGVMNAKKILHSSQIVYNYRKRKSGVMLKPEYQKKIIFDKLDYLDKRRKKVILYFPELKQDFDYHFLSMLLILSRDSAATKESIQITQQLLQDYFKGEKHCRMEFALRKQLFLLQHGNPAKILKHKKETVEIDANHQCFE